MTLTDVIFAAAVITLAYVVVRLLSQLRVVGRRRPALYGVVAAISMPAALVVSPMPLPREDLRVYLFGSALWMTLALALAAFALSRMPDGRGQDA